MFLTLKSCFLLVSLLFIWFLSVKFFYSSVFIHAAKFAVLPFKGLLAFSAPSPFALGNSCIGILKRNTQVSYKCNFLKNKQKKTHNIYEKS